MKETLKDFGVTLTHVTLLCDNDSIIKISNNPIQHSRIKHIDIFYHSLSDHLFKGDIDQIHISTDEELVDIFTKPLATKRFFELRSDLNILDS